MITISGETETKYYYHFDGLGSVVALSDVNSVIVERYSYDVFGEPMILSPNNELRTTSLYGNPYMFTGRNYDSETGLYYYRARYYNPIIGRFLQTDPIGYFAGLNLYTYVGNNPINWIDPWGLVKRLGIHSIATHSFITVEDTETRKNFSYALYHDSRIREYGATRLSPYTDVVINYDQVPAAPLQYSTYEGKVVGASRYVNLTREQYKRLLNFIYRDAEYRTLTNNCSAWASDCWRAATGEDLDADTSYLLGAEMPWTLTESVKEANMSDNVPNNDSGECK